MLFLLFYRSYRFIVFIVNGLSNLPEKIIMLLVYKTIILKVKFIEF